MTPEDVAADAPCVYSVDEHIARAIEILESLALCDRPDLAVEHAKAHLWLSMAKRGAE